MNNCGEVTLLPVAEELTYGEREETVLFDGVLGGEMSWTLPIGLPAEKNSSYKYIKKADCYKRAITGYCDEGLD